jgi:hypothetical protein
VIRTTWQGRTAVVQITRGITWTAAAAALLVALAGCATTDGQTDAEPSPLQTFVVAPTSASAGTGAFTAPAPTGERTAAVTPQAAVEAYLTAEVAGDYDASFGLLAQADRDRLVSQEAWRATKSRTPRITGFTVDSSATAGDRVVTDVTLQPNVDPILGVIPGSARITWTPVAEDGGWRVPIEGSSFEARYPDDAGAAPSALAWVGERQACTPSADRLVFEPELPQALCGVNGTFRAERTSPLAELANPVPVLASYGPDATTWARVVRLTGPTTIDVVTAPLGDAWVVIGATSSA